MATRASTGISFSCVASGSLKESAVDGFSGCNPCRTPLELWHHVGASLPTHRGSGYSYPRLTAAVPVIGRTRTYEIVRTATVEGCVGDEHAGNISSVRIVTRAACRMCSSV